VGLKLLSMKKLIETISNLCVCSKVGYSNGEKARYSGLMNHWHKIETTAYRYVDGEMKELKTYKLVYAYKQRKLLNFRGLRDAEEYLPIYEQRKLLKSRGDWYYPMFSYSCAFMVCTITKVNTYHSVSWASGDDRVGIHFSFPNNYLSLVKSFIEFNKNKPNFGELLDNLVMENLSIGFSYD